MGGIEVWVVIGFFWWRMVDDFKNGLALGMRMKLRFWEWIRWEVLVGFCIGI